jgi:hypothetical protein
MIRSSQIVVLVLLALALSVNSAEAQKMKRIAEPAEKVESKEPASTGKVKKSKGESLEKWTRVGIKKYKFSFAHPEDWTVEQMEHPDPDVLIPDSTVDLNANDFNGLEVNREAFETGAPYILVYAVPKHHQSFNEYYSRLQNDIEFTGAKFLGADSTATFKGFPMYDVTYEVKQYQAKVRTIVIYANGMRYGAMYTALEDNNGSAFRKHMPRFERLLETLEIGDQPSAKQ